MTRTAVGSCHCRLVTFEVTSTLDYAIDCNCSLCRRKGAMWHPVAQGAVRILTGENELTLYRFHTMQAKHLFCRHCGIHPFTRPRLDPTRWSVNLRCIDDIDLAGLRIVPFDGRNWEEAAKNFGATR
jgi:hypothetical protein